MPYIVYRDTAKKQELKAENATIADTRCEFYCKIYNCNARMTLVNGADSKRAYFRRIPSSPNHINVLCSADGNFDPTEYNEIKFDLHTVFSKIINTSNNKNSKSTSGVISGGGGKKAISTLRQVYLMCRKYSSYNGYCTDNILADERNFERYRNGISERKIVQCTVFHGLYPKEFSYLMNYPSFPYKNGKHVKLHFNTKELFWYFHEKFKTTNHKELIIVLGDWKESYRNDDTAISECTIFNKRQIHFLNVDLHE